MPKIHILHFSDLHYTRNDSEIIHSRIPALQEAIVAFAREGDAIIPVFSGDIVHSGLADEFQMAQNFLRAVIDGLKKGGLNIVSNWIVVPGNHDCDFSNSTFMRESFLSNPNANLEKLDTNAINTCVEPQKNFWATIESLTGLKHSGEESLFRTTVVQAGKAKIAFNLFNSAWISQEKEKQGSMLFPVKTIKYGSNTLKEVDYNIAIIHHPYNWFENTNSRSLRDCIEDINDIVLTGHEHTSSSRIVRPEHNDQTCYIDGAVLHESKNNSKSAFNLIEIETFERKVIKIEFQLVNETYKQQEHISEFRIGTHSQRENKIYKNNERFAEFLEDPGAQYSHPRVKEIKLSQLYVQPDLRDMSDAKLQKSNNSKTVEWDSAYKDFISSPRVLIIGHEKAGKTAMAKILYKENLSHNKIPLYLDIGIKQFPKKNENVLEFIRKEFEAQYNAQLWDQYFRLNIEKKVAIIDDLHLSKLNPIGKGRLIREISVHFGAILIFGGDSLRLEDLSVKSTDNGLFNNFQTYQILEFGHLLRSKLVEKWILMGAEEDYTGVQLAEKTRASMHMLDDLIGKNIIPSYPIFLLTLLQQMEAATSTKLATGSYGFFYEYLITKSLSQNSNTESLDLKYNYISELAFEFFKTEQKSLTDFEFNTFNQHYNSSYKLRLSANQMREILCNSGIISSNESGDLTFKYRYSYYYFVARWISQNLHLDNTKKILRDLAAHLHQEESANILIFLSYHSKDSIILDTILAHSSQLYADVAPCDLTTHIAALNDLQAKIPQYVLCELEARQGRSLAYQEADRNDGDMATTEEAKQFEELLKINQSYKTIEILGQILKNYSGSLRGETKIRLAKECINLSLRSMNFYLKLVNENLQGIVQTLIARLTETGNIDDKNKVTTHANNLVFMLAHIWAFTNIRRVSLAAGSEHLEPVYAELIAEQSTISMRIIDIAIRLDHFHGFPEKPLLALHRELHNNLFADSIIKRLIMLHFYMFDVDFKTRDRICSILDIKIDKNKILSGKSKRLTYH